MKKGISLLCALLLWSPVSNAEWARLGKTDKMSFSVDFSTLKVSGDIRRVWVRYDYERPEKVASTVAWVKTSIDLVEYDCVERRGRELQSTEYGEQFGKEFTRTHRESEWEYVIPETVGEFLLNSVCTYEEY